MEQDAGAVMHLAPLPHEHRPCRLNHQLLGVDAVNDHRLCPKFIGCTSAHFKTALTPGYVSGYRF